MKKSLIKNLQDASIGSEVTEEQLIGILCQIFQVSFGKEKEGESVFLQELSSQMEMTPPGNIIILTFC